MPVHPPKAEPIDPDLRYQMWVLQDMRTRDDLYRQRLSVPRLAYRPTISIVTPLYNTPAPILRRMLASVQDQTYPHWQHCLVDDGSAEAWLTPAMERLAASDPRIVIRRRVANGGIAAASNDALALATGDFVALLDHDDELHPEALFEVARRLNAEPETDILYSDCDVLEANGTRGHPFLFPAWSPELMLSLPYLVHLTVFRRSLLEQIGGFRQGYDGAQDFDLALRATMASDRIAHIPRVLYHWRVWEQSAARNATAKPYAYEARRRVSRDYLRARGIDGDLRDLDVPGYHTIHFPIDGEPRIDVVVPVTPAGDPAHYDGAGLIERLTRVLTEGGYPHYTVTIAGPPGLPIDPAARIGGEAVTIVTCDQSHDAGALVAAGVAQGTNAQVLLLDATVSSSREGWLSAMLEFSQQAPIGAVGARLFAQDQTMWHAGVVVPAQAPHCVQHLGFLTANYLAVSGACLLTRREVLTQTGGFRDADTVGFPDVDYCLRAWQIGLRIVYTPVASLVTTHPTAHDPYEGQEAASARFAAAWRDHLSRDPYYNPNYTDDGRFRMRLA